MCYLCSIAGYGWRPWNDRGRNAHVYNAHDVCCVGSSASWTPKSEISIMFLPVAFVSSQKLTRPLRLYSTIFRFEIKGAASRHFHCERENTIEQPKGLTPIIRWNSNRMRAMRGSEVSVPRSGTCGKKWCQSKWQYELRHLWMPRFSQTFNGICWEFVGYAIHVAFALVEHVHGFCWRNRSHEYPSDTKRNQSHKHPKTTKPLRIRVLFPFQFHQVIKKNVCKFSVVSCRWQGAHRHIFCRC